MSSDSSQRGLYLVGIVPIHSNKCIYREVYPSSFVVFKRLWKIPGEFHRYPYLLVMLCSDREIWAFCKGVVHGTQDCIPGMGASFIRTCQFPSYSQANQAPRSGAYQLICS